MADQTTEFMQSLASAVDLALNGNAKEKQLGFVILVMPFNAKEGERTNYVSNASRPDILAALKEVVARFEGQAQVSGRA